MLENKDMAAAQPPIPLRGEDGAVRADYVERVAQAIERADSAALRELVGDLHESDAGDLIEALDPELRPRLIKLMGHDFDFSALTQVDDAVREEILEELPTETVAEGVSELDSDDAVFILEDLPKDEQKEILEQLPSSERIALSRSLLYPENSAGRRMQTELIAVEPAWTVGRTIDYMRETPDLPDRFWELYVVDGSGRLQGAVALDQLLRTKRPVPITELIGEELWKVRATDDQEDVARLFERYDLVSAPVVDENDRLVGVITFDDIVDVIEEEAEEDIKALGRREAGRRIVGSGLDHRARTLQLAARQSRHRLPRLLGAGPVRRRAAKDGGACGAGADRGEPGRQRCDPDHDCSGARARDPRIVERQCRAHRPARSAGRAWSMAWPLPSSPAWRRWPGSECRTSASSSGLPMICNLLAAALGGILVPLVLYRFRADPAVSSGVFVTTVTDVVGFFSFLGIATLWFGLK